MSFIPGPLSICLSEPVPPAVHCHYCRQFRTRLEWHNLQAWDIITVINKGNRPNFLTFIFWAPADEKTAAQTGGQRRKRPPFPGCREGAGGVQTVPPGLRLSLFYTRCNGVYHLAEVMQIFPRRPPPSWKLLVLYVISHFCKPLKTHVVQNFFAVLGIPPCPLSFT